LLIRNKEVINKDNELK
jgi:hypothetical protein